MRVHAHSHLCGVKCPPTAYDSQAPQMYHDLHTLHLFGVCPFAPLIVARAMRGCYDSSVNVLDCVRSVGLIPPLFDLTKHEGKSAVRVLAVLSPPAPHRLSTAPCASPLRLLHSPLLTPRLPSIWASVIWLPRRGRPSTPASVHGITAAGLKIQPHRRGTTSCSASPPPLASWRSLVTPSTTPTSLSTAISSLSWKFRVGVSTQVIFRPLRFERILSRRVRINATIQ